jgi:hypothetical protein
MLAPERSNVDHAATDRMRLPHPRGPISHELVRAWSNGTGADVASIEIERIRTHLSRFPTERLLRDDDLHLALYACYELHYGGIDGVDDEWEWSPPLLALRGLLEGAFEGALRRLVPIPKELPRPIERALGAIVRADDGVSVSRFLEADGHPNHFGEFLMHRSAYNLKEADPHTWCIPRLRGAAKAALVEIQSDEYGGGDPAWVHAQMFADSMDAFGLDPTPGAYVDRLPGTTLATVNLMSLFGLHRRLRGASVGHLAAFEMTSCIPNRRYAAGLRRIGAGPRVTAYFDEHVEADAVHATLAAHDLAGGLVALEPSLDPDVRFGACSLLELERRAGRAMLDAWRADRSSLLDDPIAH